MKIKCIGMLLLLPVCAPALSQQNTAESPLIIEAVECRGNSTIPCEFIRGKLRLSSSSQVDDDAVQSAQLRLSALSNFESVRVYLEKGSEKGKALLIVEVVEASPIVTEVSLGARLLAVDRPIGVDRPDELTGNITGRLSHQNLFGRQKLGEITIGGLHSSSDEVDASRLAATVSYIDPNLFGSAKWFLSVSGEYNSTNSQSEQTFESLANPMTASVTARSDNESRVWSATLSVGYRLWDYSYLFARIQQQDLHLQSLYTTSTAQAPVAYEFKDKVNVALLGYGWDSEDDAYFPTRGSRLSVSFIYASVDQALCSTCDQLNWRIAYKQSWMTGKKSIWTLNVGGEPYAVSDRLRPIDDSSRGTLGLRYSYLLDSSASLGGLRRGRWYVELGTGPVELSREGQIADPLDEAHVTLGLRFESKVLGIVDLYAAASKLWPQARSGQ